MATASRSLATAQWRARFASGLLPTSYTTTGDATDKTEFHFGKEPATAPARAAA